jgi:uncharacterized repeat protein (TIGR01451 family)
MIKKKIFLLFLLTGLVMMGLLPTLVWADASKKPALVYDAYNQRYLAVFAHYEDSYTYDQVYGQLIKPDGTAYAAEFSIGSGASANQEEPSVAYDHVNHRFLVSWEDSRNDTTKPDIYGQLVSADGTLLKRNGTGGSDNFVIANANYDQYWTAAAFDSNTQNFLVVWQDYRNNTQHQIYGQLVNAGGLVGGNFAISNSDGGVGTPCIAYDSYNQRFLVAWDDRRTGSTSGGAVYGQLVNGSGQLLKTNGTNGTTADNFVISDGIPDLQQYPAMAYDSLNKNFLVVWQQTVSGPSYDIYGILVKADDGSQVTAEFVISNAGSEQMFPAAAFDSINKKFLVAWEDLRNSGTTLTDIYGQLVKTNGDLDGSNFVISNAASDQYSPAAAFNPNCANFLTVYPSWEDSNLYHFALVGSCSADLAIFAMTDYPDPVWVGEETIWYKIIIDNNGPNAATAVTLTDTLPASTTYLTSVTTQGSCNISSGTVTCSIGAMLSGDRVTVNIYTTPHIPGSVSNTATVSSYSFDPDTSNNSKTVNTTANEEIFPPTLLSGPGSWVTGYSAVFTAGGASSSDNHEIEYGFDWGDGSPTTWGSATQSHIWSSTGTKAIQVKARCKSHTTFLSAWYTGPTSINIYDETISTPGTPSGIATGGTGYTYTYTTSGATLTPPGDTVEYRFNWDDTTLSAWSTSTSAAHAWTSPGSYNVTVEARCSTHNPITKTSAGWAVTISGPTITNLKINGGAATTTNATVTLTYTLSGSPTLIRTSTGTKWSGWVAIPSPHILSLGGTNGIRDVFVQVKDSSVPPRVSPVARANIILDTTVPKGVVKINGGATTVNNGGGGGTPVRLHLAMFDANMDGAKMRIKNDTTFISPTDDGLWTDFFPFYVDWPLSVGTGSRKVYFQFKDGAGKTSSVYNASINVVATGGAPWAGESTVTITGQKLTGGSGNSYTTTPAVILTYDVSDTNVMARYLYGTSWTAWETPSISGSTVTRPLTLSSSNGPRQVYIQLKENSSGKITDPACASITLDTKVPLGCIQINNGATTMPRNNQVANTVVLTIAGYDPTSGIDKMAIYQTGDILPTIPPDGDFIDFTPTVSEYTLNTPTIGTKMVYIWFKDKAGKISAKKSDSISVIAP